MITLYQANPGARGYEQSDLHQVEEKVVPLFLSSEPALLQQLQFIKAVQRRDAVDIGINYGSKNEGRRGFYFAGILYELNTPSRIITASLEAQNLLYDRDKIPLSRHFLTEASMDDILAEFQREGFEMRFPQ